jgi:hypothetical protein
MVSGTPGPGPARTVGDTAQAVISLIAPEELPFFDELSAAYFRDPERALGQARREATKFPIPGPTELVTAVVIGALTNALAGGVTAGATRVARGGWRRLGIWRADRKRQASGPEVLAAPQPPVTPAAVSAAEDFVRLLGDNLDPGTRARVIAALAEVLLQNASTGDGAARPAQPSPATCPGPPPGDDPGPAEAAR